MERRRRISFFNFFASFIGKNQIKVYLFMMLWINEKAQNVIKITIL